ncbi:primosomal protein N' [Thermanaerothrix sp. 4228-RoL]|uniref:Replication restart protein PriA n=1 Tax=Thermanaerothrix solaris TaxID=3058434 RepID=A0ABU3NR22_9CHLR|nr:primosomal protein N' [Thermanaerothrix sp. 4228-RoL]MDT8899287.1 primosomal protein N' [Thermanaerothrix sp. 4228-RoL]
MGNAVHRYARVVLDLPGVGREFDYIIPSALQGRVQKGVLVVVPFSDRRAYGIVIETCTQSEYAQRMIESVLDDRPVVTPSQIELARILSENTLSPLGAILFSMLPPGLSQQADVLYTWLGSDEIGEVGETERALMRLLVRRGPLRGRQIDAALPHRDWRTAARRLIRRGLLRAEPVLPPSSVRPKVVRTAQLACSPEEAQAQLPHLGRPGSVALIRRQAMLRFLIQEPWPLDVTWLYAVSGGNRADLDYLAEMGLIRLSETEVWRDPLEGIAAVDEPTAPLNLTSDQQRALEVILECLHLSEEATKKPILLFGVTGSGKTEIYLQSVAEALVQGKQALVLVPEIALTPQLVRRFLARFPGQVGLIHSRLSAGERYDTWRRARDGRLGVVIGPRSALFTPMERLGLIILDEAHEPSYYQSETPPYYHAVQAAMEYARLTSSVLVLGSATPDIVQYYRAQKEGWPVLRLPERVQTVLAPKGQESPNVTVKPAPLPQVKIVDMRQELKAGNRSIFSRALLENLEQVIQAGQQAILYLNRLGASTYVFCRECGYVLKCPRCEIPLTYHLDPAELICHRCNYRRLVPNTCPQCGGREFRHYGLGTERVEQELGRTFPGIRILRLDSSTSRVKGAVDLILTHFAHHQADVLIGTQMLAKGLDLPLVTLVGIVLADVGLTLPDFRAAERAFQLLTQVAGRAGRGPWGGRVILQTFQPEHYAIRYAAHHDYEGFLHHELELRRTIGYPPFARLVRLEFRHKDRRTVEQESERMAEHIRRWISESDQPRCEVIGPAPCFYTRLEGRYRWQIVLRGEDPTLLLRPHLSELKDWRVEVDPPSLL